MLYNITSSENTNNDIFLYYNIEQKKTLSKNTKTKKVIIEITQQFFN